MSKSKVDAIKDIHGYEGLYGVTEDGRVWGYKKNHWLSQHRTAKGYMRVCLTKNNSMKLFMVHRLVADAYLPEQDCTKEINHKDYCRSNNNVKNLEWVSHAENVRYSKGKAVEQYDLAGNFIKSWVCTRQVERDIGIDHRLISDCCNGKQKTSHGYIWKYKVVK